MRNVDYLIIGAGPAGIQLGYLLGRQGRDYQILEAQDRPGVFFEMFPRHRKLLSINKRHTGYDEEPAGRLRYDWNSLLCDDEEVSFTSYSDEYFADSHEYARYLRDFVEKFSLNINYSTCVTEVTKAEDEPWKYRVTDEQGEVWQCKSLVVATGVWAPYVPDIPGIEHTENYFDCPIEPEDYVDQKVLIIGKGNSAFETANHLVSATRVTHLCSPHPIKFAWTTHFFGHLRAVNNDFLDTYILKGQNSVLDADVLSITPEDGELLVEIQFTHANGQKALLAYDRVICCAGFRWKHDFFGDDCRPELACEDRLPSMSSSWESTSLPGVYFAGTIMQIRDLKKTMSNVLHGFRSNILNLSNIVQQQVEPGFEWPFVELPLEAEAIARQIIERVSTNAGLMHQPGFLSDVVVINTDAGRAEYYETLAVDYVRDSRFGAEPHHYVITMEYGEFKEDPFAETRQPDPTKAYNDAYLHPRIRRFDGAELVEEHHVSESLENDWRLDRHLGEKPLIRKMEFIGQDDATQFQQTHFEQLVAFLNKHLAAAGVAGAAEQAGS